MEKEGRAQRACRGGAETDFVLQWGNRKRLRCFKVKDGRQEGSVRRRISIAAGGGGGDVKESQYANCFNRNSDSGVSENRKSHASSPEKEDHYYMTRGSCGGNDENGKILMEGCGGEERGYVLPKFFMTLSSKEKEEDFMAMKGCKLPQRPKKRAKFIQKCLLRRRGLKAMAMESESE
ncbi:hypothetical protein QJS10_CPA10g00264 [Acorus calamus]|uniref:Uncharacterized protein n=1 Tax=Acorus calamus TaxID=4465 RepID=A0AAV9DWD5_ACOCL|nr:hypothetical protein QJS10_CPA10g00264 [Acorus calamus]